jgi:hypothetical protein
VIAHVYKLKTQPELVCYYHAAVGFPTKPTWIVAIKNKQFASDYQGSCKAPSRVRRNNKRAWPQNKERSAIDQENSR